jgi:BirA family biotin operon repressor/biotin-[acetyl-CoA-carboxylase] ligase
MAVSLGACKGIEQVTRLQAQVKWPNDILINGRKCAGILSEAGIEANRVEYIVAGLGINVNFSATGAKGLPDNATTIADELGHSVSREELVRSAVCEIERYYFRLQAGDDLHSEWRTRIITLDKHVRADTGHHIEEGIAEDVDGDGALLLRRADGSLATLVAGEVTLSGRAKSGG